MPNRLNTKLPVLKNKQNVIFQNSIGTSKIVVQEIARLNRLKQAENLSCII